jgi:hypothetical protein
MHPSKSHGTRLASVTITKTHDIESDSTHQLANLDQYGNSVDSTTDYYDSEGTTPQNGHKTIITGKRKSASESRDEVARGWENIGGIMVTNEINMKVSKERR